MARGLAAFDRRALGGADCLIGIDEAGRGCLAGPVVAAAVRCEAAFYATGWCRRHSRMVDDSKRLSPARRAAVVARFAHACRENWIRVGVASASVEEIEALNIHRATALAMLRALRKVLAHAGPTLWDPHPAGAPAAVILIDGRPLRGFPEPHLGVVQGDRRSLAVALAGIHAKEARDAGMRALHATFPQFGFAAHKGYATAAHFAALRAHGPTPHHRSLFLRAFHARADAGPDNQGSLF